MRNRKDKKLYYQPSDALCYLLKIIFYIYNNIIYNTVTAWQLACRLIEKLLTEGKLREAEVEQLKEKTRKTFYKVVYPVLADDKENNKRREKNTNIIAGPFNLREGMYTYQQNGLMKAGKA